MNLTSLNFELSVILPDHLLLFQSDLTISDTHEIEILKDLLIESLCVLGLKPDKAAEDLLIGIQSLIVEALIISAVSLDLSVVCDEKELADIC